MKKREREALQYRIDTADNMGTAFVLLGGLTSLRFVSELIESGALDARDESIVPALCIAASSVCNVLRARNQQRLDGRL